MMYTKLNNGKRTNLIRTNSICPTPESVLLDLVLKNETDSIEKLVQNNTKLLNYIYKTYNGPILLIACTHIDVKPETVRCLINSGASLTYSNEEDWQAIHFSARATDSKLLRVVIEGYKAKGFDINALQQGNNALHILIRFGNREREDEFNECAKVLLEEGIDVNLGDGKYLSPILWAAKKGYKDIVKTIMEKSPIPVDLDSHQLRGRTARDIITSENLYEGSLPEKIINTTDTDEVKLFKLIQTKNENAFINYKNGDIFDIVDSHNTYQTLLEMACDKGLKKVVKHLLDKGADPNLKINKENSPIEIAAGRGFHDIFKFLLDHPKIKLPHSILITLLKQYEHEVDCVAGIDRAKCYRYLLDKIRRDRDILDINELDPSKNSPLHYALRYCEPDIAEELLDLGASLGAKNIFGVMPIQNMEPEKLEKHLDKCIQFDTKGKKDKENFSVTFDYRTLIPPSKKLQTKVDQETDPETSFNSLGSRELVHETEVIFYMSGAPEFKHLLTHPVIVSFLFMKWHRIRWLFYTNLAFFVAFFVSLVVFIFSSYTNFKPDESSLETFFGKFSWIALLLTYFTLLFRELFQVAVSPKKYFENFENYIELSLISITGCILFISSPSEDTRKQLSAISILLAAFELVLMFGQHPKLSTNVVMLRTVSSNFFKFFIWYSLLIIAFALSFYILFTETNNKRVNETSDGNSEDFFTDPGKSVFKTIVMLTGEFDASDLNFHTFPIISKLIFVLFIFMIAIILLNLLNGLAVSDTQTIKNDAELLGHIYRAQHIMYVESMLLGNVLPTRLLNKIEEFCCCCPFDKEWNYTVLQPLARRACLFPHILNYELTVFPNRYGQIDIPMYGKNKFFGGCCFGSCSSIYLDKDTIRRTNCIVLARKEQAKLRQESSQMQRIEAFIQEWKRSTQSEMFMLNSKVEHILRCLDTESSD